MCLQFRLVKKLSKNHDIWVWVHKFIKFWRLQLKSVTSVITKIAIKTG